MESRGAGWCDESDNDDGATDCGRGGDIVLVASGVGTNEGE